MADQNCHPTNCQFDRKVSKGLPLRLAGSPEEGGYQSVSVVSVRLKSTLPSFSYAGLSTMHTPPIVHPPSQEAMLLQLSTPHFLGTYKETSIFLPEKCFYNFATSAGPAAVLQVCTRKPSYWERGYVRKHSQARVHEFRSGSMELIFLFSAKTQNSASNQKQETTSGFQAGIGGSQPP